MIIFFSLSISIAQETTKKLLPKYQTQEEINSMIPYSKNQITNAKSLPENFTVPGEFEEMQSVVIAWPYPSGSNSPFVPLYAKLANTLQQECEVWILVDNYSDSTTVISYFGTQGVTLYNHKFLEKQTDAFWARDFGPWGYYYGANDSLGIIDPSYYSSRPNDDAVPGFIANYMGIDNYYTPLKFEGGNFMSDGYGHGFYSSRICQNNSNYNSWSYPQSRDTMKSVFGLHTATELTSLVCDGGTGHIDIYSKLLDEQTILVAEYPSSVVAPDKNTIEANVALIQTLTTTYGRPFKIHRVEIPTKDDGTYASTCGQFNSDIRGFVNGLIVNKTFIFPSFSDTTDGNVALDSVIINYYRNIMPGYKIVPIDSRLLTPWGGAIHCITIQIPTDNPIRFWHPTVEGYKPLQSNYHILAKITNKDGIANAKCYYRKQGATAWSNVALTDSSGYFVGDIPNNGFTTSDIIEYYLHAQSNNGKQMTKPIVAPDGFYKFFFTSTPASTELFAEYDKDHLFDVYPNPAKSTATISYYLKNHSNASLLIIDKTGRTVYSNDLNDASKGMNELNINISELAEGVYFYTLIIDGNAFKTKKLAIFK